MIFPQIFPRSCYRAIKYSPVVTTGFLRFRLRSLCKIQGNLIIPLYQLQGNLILSCSCYRAFFTTGVYDCPKSTLCIVAAACTSDFYHSYRYTDIHINIQRYMKTYTGVYTLIYTDKHRYIQGEFLFKG